MDKIVAHTYMRERRHETGTEALKAQGGLLRPVLRCDFPCRGVSTCVNDDAPRVTLAPLKEFR